MKKLAWFWLFGILVLVAAVLWSGMGVIALGMLAVFIFAGGALLWRSWQERRMWRRCVGTVASLLLVLGAVGFLGSAAAAIGTVPLGPGYEWPAGYAAHIATTAEGDYLVPLSICGRVQVYDAAWRFRRGWNVPALGKGFKVHENAQGEIEVATYARPKRYVYSSQGSLLREEPLTFAQYKNYPEGTIAAVVPTRWWLWEFSNPLYSWGTFMVGMVAQGLLENARRKKGSKGAAPA
jgi:hypothetical protein